MTISSSSATTWGTSGVAQTHAAPTCLRSGRPGGPALQGPRGQEGLGRARGGQSTQRARVPSGEEGGVGCLSIAITWLVPKASPPPGSPFLSLDPTLLLVLHLLGLLLVVTQSGLALGELDPGVGNGNPLRYSCLENPMDGGAWRATAHAVTKRRTQLSN